MNLSQSLYKPDEYGLVAAQYRSDAAYQLARRIAKADQQTYEEYGQEIGFKMHFHLRLSNHDPAKVNGVLTCIAAGKEFILYSDKKNYTIFIPKSVLAICYMDGREYTKDVSASQDDWENRIRLAMIGYDHFFELPSKIYGQTNPVLQLQQGDS